MTTPTPASASSKQGRKTRDGLLSSWKPSGYNSVSPYLVVTRAEDTLTFLETVLDGQRLCCFRDSSSGRILHSEIRVDDTVLMVAEDDGDDDNSATTPRSRRAPQPHVHVYVPDAAATFAKAQQVPGSRVVQPLQTRGGDDTDHRGGIQDSNGCTWWIATTTTTRGGGGGGDPR